MLTVALKTLEADGLVTLRFNEINNPKRPNMSITNIDHEFHWLYP